MTRLSGSRTSESLKAVHMKVRQQRNAFMIELLDIAAYAYQDVHVWRALLTCLRPPLPSLPSARVTRTHATSYTCSTFTLLGPYSKAKAQ